MKYKFLYVCAILILVQFKSNAQQLAAQNYQNVQNQLKQGWGTYNHKSVLSHVLLPNGLALNLGVKLKRIAVDGYLTGAYISSRTPREEYIVPGNHALNGSYTDLTVSWKGLEFRLQSATTDDGDLCLLVTPNQVDPDAANLVLEVGMLWNREGQITKKGDEIKVKLPGKKLTVKVIGQNVTEFIPTSGAYLAIKFDNEVAFYTGKKQNLNHIKQVIAQKAKALQNDLDKFGSLSKTYAGMQNVIAWNIIYDAAQDRIIYPVSRLWSDTFGGQSVLFCWDTYFAAYMASMGSKNLAYANAIEITKAITPGGFIPNWTGSYKDASFDRSQPPVGSLVFKELYRKFGEKWILEYVFDDLFKWNTWWTTHRDNDGMLCWGSDPIVAPTSDISAHTWQGAAYESGLDNSPMFDDVPFNRKTNLMEQADVGLMSLFIMDCDGLADIAKVLNKREDAQVLMARATKYRNKLKELWDDKEGMFLNKRTDTKEFSKRVSPTNFYPLLAKVPTQYQAERMVNEHLLNPKKFNGKYVLPSISIDDKTFAEQDYWRGRIWAPLNFLVYMGLLNYNLPQAKKMIVQKSNSLFVENLDQKNYVFENYNAITGNITNRQEATTHGDNYYHWGALLGFISLIDKGNVQNPSSALTK